MIDTVRLQGHEHHDVRPVPSGFDEVHAFFCVPCCAYFAITTGDLETCGADAGLTLYDKVADECPRCGDLVMYWSCDRDVPECEACRDAEQEDELAFHPLRRA